MWHLKDREFEKKLNETSYPMHTFTDALNKKLHGLSSEFVASLTGVEVVFQRISEEVILGCLMNFSSREIEEVPDYNPHAWNEYPKVTPPEGVLMRVEARTLDDYGERLIVKFYGATYVDGAWRSSVEIKYPETLQIFRFRPWEE